MSFIRAIDEATHDVQLHPITLNPSSADSSLALSSHAHQSYLPPHKWVIYMAPSHLQGWPRCWPPRYSGILIVWCMVPTHIWSHHNSGSSGLEVARLLGNPLQFFNFICHTRSLNRSFLRSWRYDVLSVVHANSTHPSSLLPLVWDDLSFSRSALVPCPGLKPYLFRHAESGSHSMSLSYPSGSGCRSKRTL